MGSSASTRAKTKTKTAESSDNRSSVKHLVCGAPSSSAVSINELTNVAGDVGGSELTSSYASQASATDFASAKVMPKTPDADNQKFESAMTKGNLDLEDMEETSSSEDSSATASLDDEAGRSAFTEDSGDAEKRLEKTSSSKGGQESVAKISAASRLREVACQSDCTGEEPDDPIVDLDAPPPSPQHVRFASGEHGSELSSDPVPPSSVPAEVPRGAVGDHEAAVKSEFQQHPCEAVSKIKGKVFFRNLQQQERLSSVCEGGICPVGDHHATDLVFAAERRQASATEIRQQRQPSTNYFPAGVDQQRLLHPLEAVVPVGLEGPLSVGDQKTEAVPDHPQQQQQQHRPAAVEGSFPGGMEGDTNAAAAAKPQQPSSPVCDVTVCEGARPKVIGVRHAENADVSNNLPSVD